MAPSSRSPIRVPSTVSPSTRILDLATTTAAVTITGGWTGDNANVYLGNTAGSNRMGTSISTASSTLGGTGRTGLFGPNGSNGIYGSTVSLAGTLTIASGITVDGTTGAIADGYYNSETVINEGTIAADGSGGGADGSITINPTNFTNQGSLEVENGEMLYVNGALQRRAGLDHHGHRLDARPGRLAGRCLVQRGHDLRDQQHGRSGGQLHPGRPGLVHAIRDDGQPHRHREQRRCDPGLQCRDGFVEPGGRK